MSPRLREHLLAALILLLPAPALAQGAFLEGGISLARGDYANAITPGRHFSTFGGSPLGATMTSAMLDWLTPGNLAAVRNRGDVMRSALEGMGCKGVRGPGMLIAFDFKGDCLKLAEQTANLQTVFEDPFRP